MYDMMSGCVAFFLLASATQLLHVNAKNISFHVCKSEGGKLLEIDVTNNTCTVGFIPNEEIKTALIEICGIIAGVKVPFTTSDGCKAGMKCPVKSGQETKLSFTLFVSRDYPSLNLVVQLDMRDQTKKMNFCVQFNLSQLKAKGLRGENENKHASDAKV
jgi:hypothetical protein